MRRLVLVLAVLLTAGGSAHAAAPTASSEQLLAADVPWSTVQQVAGTSYWPEPPGFDTTVFQTDPQPKTAVSQVFDQLGGRVTILTRVLAFGSSTASEDYLIAAQVVGERVDHAAPAVGEQRAYWRTTLTDGSPSTRLYLARGPFAALVQIDHAGWSQARIGKLAAPIDAKLRQLLAGTLPAPALSAAAASVLPKPSAAPGSVLGTTVMPVEAWSTVVLKSSPRAVRAELAGAGVTALPFRRYLLRGSATNAIETTAFTFGSAAAAQRWFAPFGKAVEANAGESLPAGATGPHAAFRFSFGSYELRFVAGRHAGDVFCWAPFTAAASPACEAATRMLAQSWFRQLEAE